HLSMVYDAARQQIVMYGGQYFPTSRFYRDTWTWDAGGWMQTDARAPDVRYHYAMAYDAARQQALVFGGANNRGDLNDLWAWNGEAWVVIDRGTGPARRSGVRMAFDELDGVMVLFGGRTGQSALDDTWLWDGETWTEYESDQAPPARSHHAMAYDRVRHKIVLFGGYGADNYGDTWEWDMTGGWVEAGGG
ncbi:MAG: kelch repeat-containing protein, partial [Anaerolineae bacterium]